MTACIENWKKELFNDIDKTFILDGICSGFKILDDIATLHDIDCGNYRSSTCPENFKQVQLQVLEEINKGHYIVSTTKPKMVSAKGAVPKKNSSEIRLIHNASRPI